MTSDEILEPLRSARDRLNLTWQELAQQTGYNYSTILAQLKGLRPARLDLLIDTAQVLGYEIQIVPAIRRTEA